MSSQDQIQRSILPIPDLPHIGLTTYDAKDPDTSYPPIRAAAAAAGRAQRADHPDRRRRLRLVQRLRRALPDAERGEAGGGRPEVQPLPHHRAVLADAAGAADRPQPPLRRHGRHHRDRHRRAGLQLGAAQHHVAARADAQAQRLLHGAVRQVPRGAGVADEPGRAVRRLAHGRRRLRVLLRLHRRRGQPVVPDALRGHHAGRAEEDARRGLPLHGGHDRQGHQPGSASRRRSCPTSRSSSTSRPAPPTRPHHVPKEWADKYKGKFDQGWDKLREETFARQKKLGVIPADCQLTARHKEIPAWDDMPEALKPVLRRQMEVYAGFMEYTDHHVGRLLDALEKLEHPRRHAGLLHHRRQRRLGRGHAERHLQRDDQLQRHCPPSRRRSS